MVPARTTIAMLSLLSGLMILAVNTESPEPVDIIVESSKARQSMSRSESVSVAVNRKRSAV